MSYVIVPDVAKAPLLRLQLGVTSLVPHVVKLFQNDVDAGHGTVKADLVECSFSGYASELIGTATVSNTLDAQGRAFAQYNAIQWTKSGAVSNLVWGYWTENASGDLLWLEKFDQPVNMVVDGVFIQLTPKFTGMSQFANT